MTKRAAVTPRARALLRRYHAGAQKGWPPAGPSRVQEPAVGRHRVEHQHRPAVTAAGRMGGAPNRSARREDLRRQSDQEVCALYEAHYRALAQLAALLVGDLEAAEEIAQAAFIAVYRAWRLRDTGDMALLYLRREVVRRARSHPSARRRASEQTAHPQTPGSPEAARAQAILSTLPIRQREAVILRYWADMSDNQIAAVTGARLLAVTGNLERALAALAAGNTG